MFATLEGFSVFFFICLALIVLCVWYEDEISKFIERRESNGNKKRKTKGNRANCR